MSPRRFVIVSAPRTGSTLLRLALDSIEGVRCHGELFEARRVLGYEDGFHPLTATPAERTDRAAALLARRDRDPEAFLRHALTVGMRASGLKLLYQQLLSSRWRGVMDAIAADTEVRVVHLIRRDELKRYVSEKVVEAGGPIHSRPGGRSSQVKRIRVDPDEFLARLVEIRHERSQALEALHAHPLLEISYEDLASRFHDTLGRVTEFLGVDARSIDATPPLSKVGHDDLDRVVTNVDELRADDRVAAYLSMAPGRRS